MTRVEGETAEMNFPPTQPEAPTVPDQQERNGHGWRKVAAVVVIGAAAVGAYKIYDAIAGGNNEVDPTSVNDIDDLRKYLTVSDTSVDCVEVAEDTETAKVGEYKDTEIVIPKVNAILPVKPEIRTQDNRLWSSAVANPETSSLSDKEALEKEFVATMCEDPEVASMAANYFANLTVVDGDKEVKVVDLNPWLEGYQGDPSVINDNALKLLPGFGKDPKDMSDAEYKQAIKANQQHAKLAEKLGTLLDRFANLGVQEHTTIFSYDLAAGSLSIAMPEMQFAQAQYNGRFLTFQLTTKDGRCLKAMLINVDDQRIGESLTCFSAPPGLPPIEVTVPKTTDTTRPKGTTTTTGPTGTTTTTKPTTTTTIERKVDENPTPGPDDGGIRPPVTNPASETPGGGPHPTTPNNQPTTGTTIKPNPINPNPVVPTSQPPKPAI